MRLAIGLLVPLLAIAPAANAAPPPELGADLRQILADCHRPDPAASHSVTGEARVGPYGTIAFSSGRHPCELSFELVSADMNDVHRIVQAWVRSRDPGATYRDPGASGGRRAIWAMKRSTLRLEFGDAPTRGRLSVAPFPSYR